MTKSSIAAAVLAACASVPAFAVSYKVTTTWREPETEPNDSIFIGTFDYNPVTHAVTNLQGKLSESMTGGSVGYPNDTMTWLTLSNQLDSWYDGALNGTFAAVFLKDKTKTFQLLVADDEGNIVSSTPGWKPEFGVAAGGIYAGFPGPNFQNAYALIFVPDNPTAALTQAQIDKLAYADCAPGGMMGAVCMTGTSVAGYGAIGTMSGYPLSQTITAVPEPGTYGLMLTGAAFLGVAALKRRRA